MTSRPCPSQLIIGQMSGTSLDGVDSVLVRFDQTLPTCVASDYRPYEAGLRARLLDIQRVGFDELDRACTLGQELATHYARGVESLLRRAGITAAQVKAIGCHGQTIRHKPQAGYSLQLNAPAWLAERTGITVVADFRSRDIAAGGQGAPLTPAFHHALWAHPVERRAIVNIGGIANLTCLAPGQAVQGFDCGPGNMLLDAWAKRHLGTPFDRDGQWAAKGRCLPEWLAHMQAHSFFGAAPPKSAGREEFGESWWDRYPPPPAADPADVQASLLQLTVFGITCALAHCGGVDALYVCGGGARNLALMGALAQALPGLDVKTTETLGLDVQQVEAMAFAWLALQCLQGQVGNLTAVTGACGPRILGAIYPGL
jgi:anhydro-N-acetylmuramic acid kinase